MTSVRRALGISFLERYLTVALALASNIILARLLTPHEIGLYSVSLAVIGIAQVLREFGIGNYLIQEPNINEDHLRTAFGVSLVLGSGLFLVVLALAPFAADFYEEPAMTVTMWIAALNFLVLPFCTVRLAMLRRAMKFKALLYVSLAATATSQAATVGLAWMDFGANSMAIGSVVMNLGMAIGTWVASEDRRVRLPSLRLWRPLVRFGGQSALTNALTSVSMDANDLVVGKVLGFGPVAMISRAQGLINLFHRDLMGAVRNVAMPAFARSHREGEPIPERFGHSMAVLTAIAWSFYGLLAVYSLEATRLLYGSQWDEAALLVPVFCAAAALGTVNSLIPTMLVAVGRIDIVTKMELVVQPLRLALVIGAALVFQSMEAVAWAFFAASAFVAPFFVWMGQKGVPGTAIQMIRTVVPSALVTLAVILPAMMLRWKLDFDRSEPIFLPLVAGTVVVGVIAGLMAAIICRHPITKEALFLKMMRQLGHRLPERPVP